MMIYFLLQKRKKLKNIAKNLDNTFQKYILYTYHLGKRHIERSYYVNVRDP